MPVVEQAWFDPEVRDPPVDDRPVVALRHERQERALTRLGGEIVVTMIEVQNLQVRLKQGPCRADQVGRRVDRRGCYDDRQDVEDEPEVHGPPHEPETRSSGKSSGVGRDRGIVGVDGHVAISDPRGLPGTGETGGEDESFRFPPATPRAVVSRKPTSAETNAGCRSDLRDWRSV